MILALAIQSCQGCIFFFNTLKTLIRASKKIWQKSAVLVIGMLQVYPWASQYSVCNCTHGEITAAVDSRMALKPIGYQEIRKCTHKTRTHTQTHIKGYANSCTCPGGASHLRRDEPGLTREWSWPAYCGPELCHLMEAIGVREGWEEEWSTDGENWVREKFMVINRNREVIKW